MPSPVIYWEWSIISIPQCPGWEDDEAIDEFMKLVNMSVLLRTLVVEYGFTEVTFRNPATKEERVILDTSLVDTAI
jgi:hypothetical protein